MARAPERRAYTGASLFPRARAESLRPRTYIVYCTWACLSPVALAVIRIVFDAPASVPAQDDAMFAILGTLMAGLFTYPTGIVGTIASGVAVYFGLVTPTESVLLATPLYVAAGYFQWYVLIPRYFRGGAVAALGGRRRRAG